MAQRWPLRFSVSFHNYPSCEHQSCHNLPADARPDSHPHAVSALRHDVTGARTRETAAAPTRMHRLSWVPLALVVGSLILLAVMPVAVSYRVRQLQHNLIEVSDQARIVVNDLEEALVTELLAQARVPNSGNPGPSGVRRDSVEAQVAADVAQLDSLSRRISPEAAAMTSEVHTLIVHWNTRRGSGSGDGEIADALRSARSLEAYLDETAATQRLQIRRVERVDIWSALILAPLALASVVAVFAVGKRATTSANEAEAGRAALARALDAKASLMRGVTHDLKNPLSAAAGYAELLRDGVVGELAPQQRDMVARLGRLVNITLDTVEDLLNLSRAEARELSIAYADVDMMTLTETLVEDYRGAATTADLALKLTTQGEQRAVSTDSARVRQILDNLLSNAMKYTPSGGCVEVSLIQNAEDVRIDVSDTGPGIPQELHDRVFDEFFRVPGNSAQGVGIGLAISRRIARLLGGDLMVGERAGGGAKFTLTLPRRA